LAYQKYPTTIATTPMISATIAFIVLLLHGFQRLCSK
jgi:hypothetical protein